MDVYEAIKGRRSVRKYKKGEAIDKAVLEKIADAGNYAPSARSEHPWKFIILDTRERIEALQEIIGKNGVFLKDASAAIITVCEDTKYYLEDGCAAIENMLLAVHAEGLGACWIAGDKKDYCTQVLEFIKAPEKYKLIGTISIGKPGVIPQKTKPTKEETVKWDSF